MIQERIQKEYQAIQFPVIFQEEDRGFFRCCEPETVLADGGSDTWKTDITPAWIKLSSSSDTVEFVLEDCDGNPTTYAPAVNEFINEENAFYTEVHWIDVLNSDGEGTYSLRIVASISGIPFNYVWGQYKLYQYSFARAKGTARVRAFFNLKQEIEGIDFTDSNVQGTFRFKGMIGKPQPNTQIDNLIHEDRQMKSVVRENLYTYDILTDPLKAEHLSILTDLYLLSENQLFITDHNAHNTFYNILDKPVILEESAEIGYYDLSRNAPLTAKVADKFKAKRTYYG